MDNIKEFCKKFNVDESAVNSLTSFIGDRINTIKEKDPELFNKLLDKKIFEIFVEKSVRDWSKLSDEFFARMLNPKTEKDHQDLENLKTDVYEACRKKANEKMKP